MSLANRERAERVVAEWNSGSRMRGESWAQSGANLVTRIVALLDAKDEEAKGIERERLSLADNWRKADEHVTAVEKECAEMVDAAHDVASGVYEKRIAALEVQLVQAHMDHAQTVTDTDAVIEGLQWQLAQAREARRDQG